MAISTIKNMCQFTEDGERKYGEYVTLDDGECICAIPSMSNPCEIVCIRTSEGNIAEGVEDFMTVPVVWPADHASDGRLDGGILREIREQMAKTSRILKEYEDGVLDEHDAGRALCSHWFGAKQSHAGE